VMPAMVSVRNPASKVRTLRANRQHPSCLSGPALLWIDDFEPGLILYRMMFEKLGFKVLTASSGEAALKLISAHHLDVVVTDYEMAGMNGEAVARAVKSHNSNIPVILFSGSTLVPLRARRVVDAFCDKAGSREQLLSTVYRVLHKKGVQALQPPPVDVASDEQRRTVA
jgi:DNA-binding NtrC family response regulator